MAISNHERVGKALGLLKDGLRPFVEREMQAFYRTNWTAELRACLQNHNQRRMQAMVSRA